MTSHPYTLAGTYTASLVAQGGGVNGTPAASQNLTVYPYADFLATSTGVVHPLYVVFTDHSTGLPTTWTGSAPTWNWTFGDGGTSSLQNPTNTYRTPGLYNVTLTVSYAGLTNTTARNNYIAVDSATRPPFRVSVNGRSTFFSSSQRFLTGPANHTVTFYAYTSRLQEGTRYGWDFGDESIPNPNWTQYRNITHTYPARSGVYDVTLEVLTPDGIDWTITRPQYIVVR
jgi:PKD repeat protein